MARPGLKKQSRYHHGDLRQALLTSCLEILDRAGVDAVTVRATAREAGVAHSAPANHFKDRAALLTQLALDIFAELLHEIDERRAKSGGDLTDQLHAFADAVLNYAWRRPNRYRLLWRRDSINPDHPDFQAAGAAIYERLREVLATADGARTISPDTFVVAAWSLVHGYISLRLDGALLSGRDEISGESRERAIVTAMIAGFK